ncbi:MAG: ABC transporter ATP-binding protein/permease [Spirochaetia bacterium]|jgi:ATP-binding cassette subfamily B protein|nr:ABC transporter ATP-binding protein/permease [Spirochaetia bacterium]
MSSKTISGAAGEGLAAKVFRYPLLCLVLALAAGTCVFCLCSFILAAGDVADALGKAAPPGAGGFSRLALRGAFCALLYGFAACIADAAGRLLGARVEWDCRRDCYAELAAKDFAFYTRSGPEEFLDRLTEDPRAAGRAVYPGFFRLFHAGAACLASLAAITFIHPVLLPLPAIFTVFVFFALGNHGWNTGAAALEEEARLERLNADIAEAGAGRETIVSQAMEADTINRFNTDARFLRDGRVRREKAAAWYPPSLFSCFFLAAAVYEGFFLQQKGFIGPGGLVSFFGFFSVFFYAARICPAAYAACREAAPRVFSPQGQLPRILPEGPPAREEAVQGAVEFDNVFFSYGSSLALRRASFSAGAGAFVAITGASGSGKTTLARLAAGLLEADMGTISIDARDSREYSPQTLRSAIAFIAEDAFLFPLSIGENIALGSPQAEERDIIEAARRAGAHGFISRLEKGYGTRAGEGGAELSADQRLRVALARVFLQDPRILVIDDAAVSADSAAEDEILRAIGAAAEGRTSFVVSHRLSQIRWADLVLVMKNGAILCQGKHEQLIIESADYRRIFSGL